MGAELKGCFPFVYPLEPHVRKHGPMGYPKYGLYRNWLRDEFTFTCVYCLRREKWATLKRDWEIDHVLPKSAHLAGLLDYDNLVYSCSTCNRSKASYLAPEPCKAAYGKCVIVHNNGEIHPIEANSDGITLIETIGLDSDDYNEMRRQIIMLSKLMPVGSEDFNNFFGYPNNLPDLSKELVPPRGNKRPKGISNSCYEQSKRGQLPKYY